MTHLTQELVRELLHYDPDTGVFTWRHRARHHFKSDLGYLQWNPKHAGKIAGCEYKTKKGYSRVCIRVLGKLYFAHQLAFLYMYGEFVEIVDHLNRDATDNRWDNLRIAAPAINSMNASLSPRNTSGVCGVSWVKSRGKWEAKVGYEYKTIHLGRFDTLDSAEKAVLKKRKELGFTDGHGKKRPQ